MEETLLVTFLISWTILLAELQEVSGQSYSWSIYNVKQSNPAYYAAHCGSAHIQGLGQDGLGKVSDAPFSSSDSLLRLVYTYGGM